MENGKMIFGGGDLTVGMNNATELNDALKEQAVKAFNDAFDLKKEEMDSKIKSEMETAQEITEKMNSMEIVPLGSYVLVNPFKTNPFEKIEINDGIIIPQHNALYQNPDSGEMEEEYNFSVQAEVIEVGPACKYVKEGDVVYYRRAQGIPIPFFRQGLEVVSENQIHVVINEGIKERFKNLNNG